MTHDAKKSINIWKKILSKIKTNDIYIYIYKCPVQIFSKKLEINVSM